jgi:hypothetical protein
MTTETPKQPLTPEDKTNLAHKRVFYAFIVLDVLLVMLIVWAVIQIFLQ